MLGEEDFFNPLIGCAKVHCSHHCEAGGWVESPPPPREVCIALFVCFSNGGSQSMRCWTVVACEGNISGKLACTFFRKSLVKSDGVTDFS